MIAPQSIAMLDQLTDAQRQAVLAVVHEMLAANGRQQAPVEQWELQDTQPITPPVEHIVIAQASAHDCQVLRMLQRALGIGGAS